MTNFRRTAMIFGLLLVGCAILFACACEFASAQNVEGQIIAAEYGEFQVPGQTIGSFQFPPAVCQVSGGGKNFSAFATGRPIKIVDGNPSLTEIATPSSVYITACSLNMATTYTHVPPYYLTSGTGGLQEAITANQTNNGINSIILNWEWYRLIQTQSASAVIGSVTGITSLGLVDITTTPYTYYRWNGSQYVAIPTNGSVASVGLTAPGSVFGVTGSPVTVSGNLGLTLNSQAQNTALRGPSSGGSGAVTFRTDTSADVLQAGTLYNALTSGNINGMMFPAQCGGASPPSWCSGTTPDAWYRAACTQLPSAGGFINLRGLTGTIAASATCSTPTKQVITLEDPTSPLTITEADGGIAFPQDNGSMFLGPGAGQCPNAGGIHLQSGTNITSVVGPAHTDGTQEAFTETGLCIFGATGATVTQGLVYAKNIFTNTTMNDNNLQVCNTACLKLVNVSDATALNNELNVTDGNNVVTASGLIIQATGPGTGCLVNRLHISGSSEHANGGGPDILVEGDGAGALACDVWIDHMHTERGSAGTPSTNSIVMSDCINCSLSNVNGGGNGGTGALVLVQQTAAGRTQNLMISNLSNIFGTYPQTLNDTVTPSPPLTFTSVPQITTYYVAPGYQQPPVLPGTVLQSVAADLMGGAGNFATGSGTLGTNFTASGCNGSITCTYTRTNSTAPPGSTFSQQIQITANADPSAGFNGVQYAPSISFTASPPGQPYIASFWGKGDGTFTGLPTFLLWDSTVPTFYCQGTSNTPFTTTWTLYSFTCAPGVSGSGTNRLNVAALTPVGQTGTFWVGGFTFSPIAPLTPGNLLTSINPYGIGPATNAQQTITLGATALLLGNTYTAVAGLALSTSSINGVTPTTGGSATTFLNAAGNYTSPTLTGTTGTITGTALSATCDSGTATVSGAVVGHPVAVSSTTGADVGGAFNLRGSVTAANTVTVYVCGTGTPSSLAYNVAVF